MGRTPCELDRRGMRDWDEFRRCWAHAEDGRWARRSRTGTVAATLDAGRGISAASSTSAPCQSPPSGMDDERGATGMAAGKRDATGMAGGKLGVAGLRSDWGRSSREGDVRNQRFPVDAICKCDVLEIGTVATQCIYYRHIANIFCNAILQCTVEVSLGIHTEPPPLATYQLTVAASAALASVRVLTHCGTLPTTATTCRAAPDPSAVTVDSDAPSATHHPQSSSLALLRAQRISGTSCPQSSSPKLLLAAPTPCFASDSRSALHPRYVCDAILQVSILYEI
jgi:hypothetical protein